MSSRRRQSKERSRRSSSIADALKATPPDVRRRRDAQEEEAYRLLDRLQPTPIENSSDEDTTFDPDATKRQLFDAINQKISPDMGSSQFQSAMKNGFLRFAPLGENNAIDDERRWIYRKGLKYAKELYRGTTTLDPDEDPLPQIFPEFIPLPLRDWEIVRF